MKKNCFFCSVLIATVILSFCLTGCRTSEPAEAAEQTEIYRKCIAAPYLQGGIALDGALEESIWKNAGCFDDFILHRKKGSPQTKTEVRVFHDEEYLYFGVKCHEKRENITVVNDPKESVMSGDYFELFLGNMEPEPYVAQMIWGPGTSKYAAAPYWDSKSMIYDDCWTSETRIRLSALKVYNSTLMMHLARYTRCRKEQIVWGSVGHDFHTLPKYHELVLGSYNLAAQVKFRHYADHKLTRAEYEKLNAEYTVPAEKIEFGPWLFAASETEMNIGWYTNGRTGGVLKYRKKGTEKFQSVRSHLKNDCYDKDKRLHKIQLKNLERGTTYEYRIKAYASDESKAVIYPEDGTLYSFTTHGKKDLTIGCFSDVHNEGYGLSPLFSNEKLMNSCDLLVNIGDMLSNSNGLRSIFIGYLDAQLPFASKKPILNFRGNHEYVGCSPNTFFDVFGTPDFKGYSMTRFGDVCLIGLDVWNSEQRKWLKEAIKHPDFQTAKHRILIAHFPATHAGRPWAATLLKTLDGIFTGKDPAATIDLLVAGHIHTGSYTKKNTGVTVPTTGKPYPPAVKVPFDMVVNEGARRTFDNCMTLVEVKGDSMTVKMLRLDGSVSKEYKVK